MLDYSARQEESMYLYDSKIQNLISKVFGIMI